MPPAVPPTPRKKKPRIVGGPSLMAWASWRSTSARCSSWASRLRISGEVTPFRVNSWRRLVTAFKAPVSSFSAKIMSRATTRGPAAFTSLIRRAMSVSGPGPAAHLFEALVVEGQDDHLRGRRQRSPEAEFQVVELEFDELGEVGTPEEQDPHHQGDPAYPNDDGRFQEAGQTSDHGSRVSCLGKPPRRNFSR